jgi:hypothetical protein
MPAEARVIAAWRDYQSFRDTDGSADKLAGFVNRHFPALAARPEGTDLNVRNLLGEELFIRRVPRTGHGGFVAMQGSDNFQISELAVLLNAGGGTRRNFEGLVKHLAEFNNRFPSEKSHA